MLPRQVGRDRVGTGAQQVGGYAITTSTPAGDNGKNAILRYYLVATNATGQQSDVSLGEVDPKVRSGRGNPVRCFWPASAPCGTLMR